MRMLRRIGRPASCKIESCRVNWVSTFDLTPPMAKPRFFFAVVFSAFFFRSFLTEIFVTK